MLNPNLADNSGTLADLNSKEPPDLDLIQRQGSQRTRTLAQMNSNHSNDSQECTTPKEDQTPIMEMEKSPATINNIIQMTLSEFDTEDDAEKENVPHVGQDGNLPSQEIGTENSYANQVNSFSPSRLAAKKLRSDQFTSSPERASGAKNIWTSLLETLTAKPSTSDNDDHHEIEFRGEIDTGYTFASDKPGETEIDIFSPKRVRSKREEPGEAFLQMTAANRTSTRSKEDNSEEGGKFFDKIFSIFKSKPEKKRFRSITVAESRPTRFIDDDGNDDNSPNNREEFGRTMFKNKLAFNDTQTSKPQRNRGQESQFVPGALREELEHEDEDEEIPGEEEKSNQQNQEEDAFSDFADTCEGISNEFEGDGESQSSEIASKIREFKSKNHHILNQDARFGRMGIASQGASRMNMSRKAPSQRVKFTVLSPREREEEIKAKIKDKYRHRGSVFKSSAAMGRQRSISLHSDANNSRGALTSRVALSRGAMHDKYQSRPKRNSVLPNGRPALVYRTDDDPMSQTVEAKLSQILDHSKIAPQGHVADNVVVISPQFPDLSQLPHNIDLKNNQKSPDSPVNPVFMACPHVAYVLKADSVHSHVLSLIPRFCYPNNSTKMEYIGEIGMPKGDGSLRIEKEDGVAHDVLFGDNSKDRFMDSFIFSIGDHRNGEIQTDVKAMYGICMKSKRLFTYSDVVSGRTFGYLGEEIYCLLTTTIQYGLHIDILNSIQNINRLNRVRTGKHVQSTRALTEPFTLGHNCEEFLDAVCTERLRKDGESLRIDFFEGLPGICYQFPFPEEIVRLEVEWCAPVLFSSLSLDDLLFLLGALMAEKSIIIVGSNITQISAMTFALGEIIFPFEGSHIRIPILPSHLIDFLDAPVPVLIGLQEAPEDYDWDSQLSHSVWLFLDRGEMLTSKQVLNEVVKFNPRNFQSQIAQDYENFPKVAKSTFGLFSFNSSSKQNMKRVTKVTSDLFVKGNKKAVNEEICYFPNDLQVGPLKNILRAIQDNLCELCATLLEGADLEEVYQAEYLNNQVKNFKRSDQKQFVKTILKTQMFTSMIDKLFKDHHEW
eukprot:CAMPEP_0115019794 /NCGR_PEP_ID=MMETSP0216-20121206/29682_1 /TAXON_ID=223996 /ORGANISM="Protocruzia adherens, Strain Boccale" /LENGTH=1058 /DNA_ID=CAMNT_0002391385 /DNA_START=95 /DNA_END=3271 /DNA_ORIENTATION=+